MVDRWFVVVATIYPQFLLITMLVKDQNRDPERLSSACQKFGQGVGIQLRKQNEKKNGDFFLLVIIMKLFFGMLASC